MLWNLAFIAEALAAIKGGLWWIAWHVGLGLLVFLICYNLGALLFVIWRFPDKRKNAVKLDGIWTGVVFGLGALLMAALGVRLGYMPTGWIIFGCLSGAFGIGVMSRNYDEGCNGCPILTPVCTVGAKMVGSKPMENYSHFWEDDDEIDKNWKDKP